MSSWEKYDIIRPEVVNSLRKNGFKQPTGIQIEVLENYKHYYDFLLASQTGSGKTLAFGIPLISQLITYKQDNPQAQQLKCLILTPTRQLATQINDHLNAVNPNKILKIVTVVGGLSKDKQKRQIQSKPDILIATPGRLNEFLESPKKILDLSCLRFIVIDQADRMVQLGHFKQVDNILDNIFKREVETFDDVLQKEKEDVQQEPEIDFTIKNNQFNFDINSLKLDQLIQLPSNAFQIFNQAPIKNKSKAKSTPKSAKNLIKLNEKVEVAKKQQTPSIKPKLIKKKIFLVSATLTRQFKDTKYYTKKKDKQEQIKNKSEKTDEDSEALAPKLKALISRITFTSKPKIIDLSGEVLIPKLLEQYVCYCEDQNQKLAYLLCYLSERLDPSKKVIIFTNTIKVSKRLSEMLTLLKHPNQVLHSYMQQRQRLNKLDRFSKGKNSPLLISTDLAARGLDMVIDIVIQFGVPVNGDTYVHRLGRTARAGRTGENLIIVGKSEYNKWKDILAVIQSTSTSNHHGYLPVSKEVNRHLDEIRIAQKAYLNNRIISKQESKIWLKKQAEEAQIILDQQPGYNKDEGRGKSLKQIKKINKMYMPHKPNQLQEKVSKWKKNKFVMDTSDIQAYLSKL